MKPGARDRRLWSGSPQRWLHRLEMDAVQHHDIEGLESIEHDLDKATAFKSWLLDWLQISPSGSWVQVTAVEFQTLDSVSDGTYRKGG
jgi:hypothetical protein